MPESFGKRGRIARPEPAVARASAPANPPAAAAEQLSPAVKKILVRVGMVCGLAVVGALGLFNLQPASRGSQTAGLIPEAEVPETLADGAARSRDLVTRFPDDPRSHFFRAVSFLYQSDAVAAEQELRTALAERAVLTTALQPQFEPGLHMVLAFTFLIQGRRDDAKTEAQPVCNAHIPEYESVLQKLRNAGICS